MQIYVVHRMEILSSYHVYETLIYKYINNKGTYSDGIHINILYPYHNLSNPFWVYK